MHISFERGPVLFAPAWRFSLGFVLGFYPSFPPLGLRAALGLAGLALSAILASRGGDRPRAILAAAISLGAASGSIVSGLIPGLVPGSVPRAPTIQSASVGIASVPAGQPRPLTPVGIEGRLRADSRPARAGQRTMDVAVDKVLVGAPGVSGSYSTRARLRLIVREGPSLAAGARVEAGGVLADGPSSLFFSDRRELVVREKGGPAARLRNRLHDAFIGAILAGVSPGRDEIGDEAGLLLALLAGWQDELSPADAAAFRGAGCTHILALSGQHLTIIAAGVAFLLKPLVGRLRALIPTLGIVSLYVFVVGPGPSLLRAVLSFALVVVATLTDRPQEGRSILGLCFAIHALLFPDQLREAGFVLSYLAVAGLVVLGPRIDYLIAGACPPALAKPLSAGLAAQTATAPWIVLTFGVFQPVGILATMVTAALVEAVMIGGLVSAFVALAVPAAAALTAPLESFLVRLLEGSMRFFAALPSFSFVEPVPKAIVAIAIVLFATFIYILPHARFSSRDDTARV